MLMFKAFDAETVKGLQISYYRSVTFFFFPVTPWLKAVSAQTSLISCHNCDWGDNLVFFDPFVFVTFVILVS